MVVCMFITVSVGYATSHVQCFKDRASRGFFPNIHQLLYPSLNG